MNLDRLRKIIRETPASGDERYTQRTKLGEGGMGEVWKAWDARLGRWVALKFLKGAGSSDLERFRREAQSAARLAHPNIVAVHDAGELEGRPFISMDFVEGVTLGDRALELRRAAEIARDAARAISYAHEQGIIHRDLKPQNLMVDAGGRLRILDFGLARPVGGGTITLPGAMVGTPAYMSPEQAEGDPCGPRSDVYSLGATLHHLIGGRPPFEGKSDFDVVRRVRAELPPRLGGAPPDLENIVLKAMEKDPSRRYAAAKELAEDLDRWLEGQPVEARPSTLRRLVWRARKRGVMLIAIVLLVVAGIVATDRYRRAVALGEEGIALAAGGLWDEARAKLERSTATWSIQRYERELVKVEQMSARRKRADQLGLVYEDVERRLETELRHVEEIGLGARPSPAETSALLDRVEAELAKIPSPWTESSLPHAIRGWVLCHIGRIGEGEAELELASAAAQTPGDPYGKIFRTRWRIRKACLAAPPGSLPSELLEDLRRHALELTPLPGVSFAAQPHAGSQYRHLIRAMAGTDPKVEVEALAAHPGLRVEALMLAAWRRAEESAALLEECVRLRPGNVLAWRWLGEAEMARSRFDEAARAFQKAFDRSGSSAIRERLEAARSARDR